MAVRRRLPVPQIGSPDSPFNVVPVDFVIDAIAAAAADPAAAGKTLHLVDPQPVSAAELLELLARAYTGRPPRLRYPPALIDLGLRSRAVRRLFADTPRESVRYLNHPVRFDTTQASTVVSRNGLRCPRFPEYVGAMVRFFAAHEHDNGLRPAHEK
jgi:uncharacterized protein YbjT (DUF2867 family)